MKVDMLLETKIIAYEKQPVILPDKFLPQPEFLDYHLKKHFQKISIERGYSIRGSGLAFAVTLAELMEVKI